MHILEHAIEVERLALLALQLIEGPQRSEPALEKSFREALPRAVTAGGTNRRVPQAKGG